MIMLKFKKVKILVKKSPEPPLRVTRVVHVLISSALLPLIAEIKYRGDQSANADANERQYD